MNGDGKAVLKLLAQATLKRKPEMIQWMNEGGWAQLPPNTPLMKLNIALSNNIENKDFQKELAVLLGGGDPEYLHIEPLTVIGIIAGIVAIVGGTAKAIQVGKSGRLARQMGMDQFRGMRGQYEWLKKQAEIESRRDFITKLASEQQEILVAEEIVLLQTEKTKRMTVIGLILLGSIGFPILYYYAVKE
jgi:hypothetical protein